MSDSTPVWSEWLPNPGNGRCPVPEWAEDYGIKQRYGGVFRSLIGSVPATKRDWDVIDNLYDITHYRYAVPASLYDLVKRRKTWHIDWHPPRIESWPRVAWLRARIDLGFNEKPEYTDPGIVTGAKPVHNDPVNHPSHYAIAPGMEAIDVIRAALTTTEFMGYLKGSILKYRLRAGRKGDAKQDLDKADWYRAEAMKRGGEG